jgi:hypothetical protein
MHKKIPLRLANAFSASAEGNVTILAVNVVVPGNS